MDNHKISSTIWDEWVRVNYSIANQIARARWHGWNLSFLKNIRVLIYPKLYEKKRDYLLMMFMPKLDYVFLLVVFISCHVLPARPLTFVPE